MRSAYLLAFCSSSGVLAAWSFDLVVIFDGWIVRSSAPAIGDPGVWTGLGFWNRFPLNRTSPPWARISPLYDLELASLLTLFLGRKLYGPVSRY
ncbi:hypothetical protein TNCV_5132091 [Trichonephila clavipes]|nr:hypothetical protein TNCV_5132091 [Trichonephila clavipes]